MFKFHLEAVLDYRRLKEEDLKKKMGELNQLLNKERQTHFSYLRMEENYREEFSQRQIRGIAAFAAKWYFSYLDMLVTRIEVQESVLKSIEERIEEKRRELVKASKEKKILEKLKERQFMRFNQELNKKEQMHFDESATYRHYFHPFLKK